MAAIGDSPPTLEALLSARPELLTRYRAFYTSLCNEGLVPRRILELARLRIAAIHGCEAEWVLRDANVHLAAAELARLERGDVSAFEGAERAVLELAELIPHSHHQVSDADVAAVTHAIGDAGGVALLTALAFFDVTCRWKMVFDVAARARELNDEPLCNGELV